MIFSSLKSRIIISVTGVVVISLAITTFFLVQKAKNELSNAIDANALNLMKATKNHVESQHASIIYHKSALLSRRKIELKNNTTIAFAIINSNYQKYKNGQLSEDDAKRHIISDFSKLRYDNGTGYFWINDITRPYPRMVMHPTIPELDKRILDDPKFNCALGIKENLFKASVDVCLEKKEGYIDYLWPKPMPGGLTEKQPKISYVKLFKPLNWVVGSGVYIDDIEKDVEARINAVIQDLNKTIIKQRIGESGYFFIFNEENFMLVHPNLSGTDGNNLINPVTGNKLLDELKGTALSSSQFMEYLWDKPGYKGEYRFPKKAYVTYHEPLRWYICSSVYKEDFEKKISNLANTVIRSSFYLVVLSFVISFLVSRSITNPIKKLIHTISKTEKDGIPIDTIPETNTIEIKALSTTMNTMIDSISKSRKELENQRDFSLGIINSSPYIICGLNCEGVTLFLNPAGERTTGYNKEEIIDKGWWEVLCPGEEHEKVSRMFNDFAEGEVVNHEMTFTCKNGERKNIIWNSYTRKNSNGNIMEIIGFGNDITDHKKAEEDIKEKEKIESIMEMAGAVCHELSQPLQIITGYSDLLIMGKSKDDQIYRKLQKITEQVGRMKILLQKLNTITRYKTKDYDGKIRIIDLEHSASNL